MRKLTLISYFSVAVIFTGCGSPSKHSEDNAQYSAMSVGVAPAEDHSAVDNTALIPDVKLIKNGSIAFKTYDLKKTREFLISSLKNYGAYASDENNHFEGNQEYYYMTVRVPSERFEELFEYIVNSENVARLDSRSIKAEDVTEDFIDIQARLKIKKESEKKLSELLGRASKLSDIFEIQNELTRIRSEIESAEGRLRYLQNRVGYGTIELTFYEDSPPKSESWFKPLGGKLRNAFNGGWNLVTYFMITMTYLWFPIIVFGVIFIIYRRRVKKKRSLKKE